MPRLGRRPGKQRHFALVIIAIALALGLAASWAAFASYLFVLNPFKRQAALLETAGLVYREGAVVVVGDSIAFALPACNGVTNLAVPGMKAADLGVTYAETVMKASPSRVVVMLGINDLRAGSAPASISTFIVDFVQTLRSRQRDVDLLVLGVLPIVENQLNADATNERIRQLNTLTRSKMSRLGVPYIELGGLLGGDQLGRGLTWDGLHLNAGGSQLVADALFSGLAAPSGRSACTKP